MIVYDTMKKYKHPETIFDIIDEAFDMVDRRVDLWREVVNTKNHPVTWIASEELYFLKDLRNLLKMKENFRE